MPFSDIIGQEHAKAFLRSALSQGRVAHAYLFHGEQRIGKRLTAVRFAQAVNCDGSSESEPDGCGMCRSCRQIESCTHPDYLLIEPDREQANPQIKIEQVRAIEQHVMYRPLVGDRKVCVVDEADRLTIGAANALLKTLEEPPAHSLFLLVTSRPFALLATIRSRCQSIRYLAPARTQVEAALILKRELPPADARFLAVLCEGRIGEALQTDVTTMRAAQREFDRLLSPETLRSAASVLSVAETLAKTEQVETATWLARWLRDVLLIRVGADPDSLLNLEQAPALRSVTQQLSVDLLLDLQTEMDSFERQASRNLNLQLALETLLLRLRDGYGGSRRAATPAS